MYLQWLGHHRTMLLNLSSVLLTGFTDTDPVSSLDGHTFRLAFANMRQVQTILYVINILIEFTEISALLCVAVFSYMC